MLQWPAYWHSASDPIARLLLPVAWGYGRMVHLRRMLYQRRWLHSYQSPAPVFVVGNLTVGGAGKTPFVIWLVTMLQHLGLRVVIVSRGYGGRTKEAAALVTAQSDPYLVGDEAVLLARRTGCRVYVDAQRVRAVKRALAECSFDVVVADDGLQHYALARNLEFALIDGERRFGNGYLLPAGPLRESPDRLKSVDFVVTKGDPRPCEVPMTLRPIAIRGVDDRDRKSEWKAWRDTPVHAVAGIGNPSSFFSLLRAHGLGVIEHPFPDHHQYTDQDVSFADDYPVFMTEKDSVKCSYLQESKKSWYVEVEAQLPDSLVDSIAVRLRDMGLNIPHLP